MAEILSCKKELIRVTTPDSIANGVRVQRDVTVALKKNVD
jgi:hypothetical protein